jgi:hypothetical protein
VTAYAFSPLREYQDWRVFKYSLMMADTQFVVMPETSEILSVQFQGEQLVMWAAVCADRPTIKQKIVIAGTGHPTDLRGLRFVGTAQDPTAPLVWHVFAGEVRANSAGTEA